MSGLPWLAQLCCPRCGGGVAAADGGLRCGACAAVYGFAGAAPDFLTGVDTEVEEDYDGHGRHSGRLYHVYNAVRRGFETAVVRSEAERLGRRVDVIDVGSGDPTRTDGYHTRLRLFARTYVGVEPGRAIVAAARVDTRVGVVRASGEQRVVPDGTVDVAVCFSALDHCVDPPRVLRNMAAAVRPGGCAIVDLKNARAWFRPLHARCPAWLARRLAPHAHAHPWEFGPAGLARAMRDAGFGEVVVHDAFYVAALLRSRSLDPVVGWLGERRWTRVLGAIDGLGRRIAPGRGGVVIAIGRKGRAEEEEPRT